MDTYTSLVSLLGIILILGLVAGMSAVQAQVVHRGAGLDGTAVGATVGSLPGGPVNSTYVGGVIRSGRSDVGIFYSGAPTVKTLGATVGFVPESSSAKQDLLLARLGVNVQAMRTYPEEGHGIEGVSPGISMTTGIPLRGERIFFQPTASFGLSALIGPDT